MVDLTVCRSASEAGVHPRIGRWAHCHQHTIRCLSESLHQVNVHADCNVEPPSLLKVGIFRLFIHWIEHRIRRFGIRNQAALTWSIAGQSATKLKSLDRAVWPVNATRTHRYGRWSWTDAAFSKRLWISERRICCRGALLSQESRGTNSS